MPTTSGHTKAIRAKKVIGTTVKDPSARRSARSRTWCWTRRPTTSCSPRSVSAAFSAMDEKYHPIPWSMLKYAKDESGYVVDLTKEQLQAAPADSLSELTKDDGRAYRDRAFDYYRSPRYWE